MLWVVTAPLLLVYVRGASKRLNLGCRMLWVVTAPLLLVYVRGASKRLNFFLFQSVIMLNKTTLGAAPCTW
jgi:hypothetical protein